MGIVRRERSAPGGPTVTDEMQRLVVHGLLLAAGRGSRMGRPKALVVGDDGESWLARSVRVLREGGCADVTVVLGAESGAAGSLLPDDARVDGHL